MGIINFQLLDQEPSYGDTFSKEEDLCMGSTGIKMLANQQVVASRCSPFGTQ